MKSGGESLAIAQLTHVSVLMRSGYSFVIRAGRQTPFVLNPNPYSASDVQLMAKRRGMGFGQPKALTPEEIQTEVVDRFVYAAKYCRDAGRYHPKDVN